MPLPKIKQPLFEIVIPSTKKKVKYRPFTVKEEKILLIAQESKDSKQMVLAIKQILNNCINDIDVDKLATFDVEYLLLNLRAQSVDNIMKFKITDPETDEGIELEIDVHDIEIQRNAKNTPLIKVNDEVMLKMKYPTIDEMMITLNSNENQSDMLFGLMINCIDSITEGEKVYKVEDFTREEVVEFVDSLSAKTLRDIQTFFETMPKMRYEKEYINSKGNKHTFVAEGTETFFI